MDTFLATYRHYYHGCSGYTSDDNFVTAENLEGLKAKIAKIHYDICFGESDDDTMDRSGEITNHWRIYTFDQGIEIEKLPEFKNLLNERRQRYEDHRGMLLWSNKSWMPPIVGKLREIYLKLKAEFEGTHHDQS